MGYIYTKVSPRDTFLFRDGTPFDKKTTYFVEGMAMPYPTAIYGMLTTALMREGYLADIKNKLMEQETKGCRTSGEEKTLEQLQKENLKINGLYLMENETLYLPAPLDLFTDGNGRIYKGIYKNGLLYPPMGKTEKLEKVYGKYISLTNFLNSYQKGRTRAIELRGEETFFGKYHKAGLEIDRTTGSAKNQHLYMAEMRETKKGVGYFVEAELLWEELRDKEWKTDVILGGRNRVSYFQQLTGEEYGITQWNRYAERINESAYVKLVFTTPYILGTPDAVEKSLEKEGIEVAARVVEKPFAIGGFDMAKGKRKTLHAALPPGSLYLIKHEGFAGKKTKEISRILSRLLGDDNTYDKDIKQSYRGFGRFLILEGGIEGWTK